MRLSCGRDSIRSTILKQEGGSINDPQAMVLFLHLERQGFGSADVHHFCDVALSIDLLRKKQA